MGHNHKHHHNECCGYNHEGHKCCGHHHHDEEHCSCEHHDHEEHHHCACNHHHHDHSCGCGCVHSHTHIGFLMIRTVISIGFIILATFFEGYTKNIILCSSYFIISYDVLLNAFKGLLKGRAFDENFLMSIASLTALIVPFFTDKAHIDPYDGILVIVLYQIGEYIQHKAVDRSKKSITEMMDLDVDKVTIIKDQHQIEIDVKDIKIDDVIVVKPGDLLVVDGVIVIGSSSINTSALTGESMPKDVYVGDEVLSGCINNDGLIHIKATTTFHNSTTSKVKEIVEKANQNKAQIDRFFTRFAKVYTPIVIAISLFVMFVLPLILGFNEHFLPYLYKGLAIMVISCPCALVISIPLAYFMGIGKAAKNKILVKGASYLEILSDCECILFDKTGTLTKGAFVVGEVVSTNINLMEELLYSCEKNFTHAIAISITKHYEDKVNELDVKDLVNIPGYGISGKYNGCEVVIGNYKLLNNKGINCQKVETENTIIYVGYNGIYLGYLTIEDELKNDAIKTISELITEFDLYIISGDKQDSVKGVAQKLGITNYYYELLPNEKIEVLEKVKKSKKVIYVGDGINDAASLISSTVGIGMRSIGSDIAIEASDIVLMDDKLESISQAIKISKKTKRIVIQNIIFSLVVKASVMFLAIFLSVPMYLAIIADVGVAMIAILNSLRILYGHIK